jgi:unsaturated rhamnogalacturonyl hydrolase
MQRFFFLCLGLFFITGVQAVQPWSQRMVESHGVHDFYCNKTHKDTLSTVGWDYVSGLIANAVLQAWEMYPEKVAYYYAVKAMADNCIANGIEASLGESNIDDLAAGKMFFGLYAKAVEDGKTSDALKYKEAATIIRNKLKYQHARIGSDLPGTGGFWHKKVYPNQMWLDGLYMGPAVYAQWQAIFGADSAATNADSWSDIALQFKTLNAYTYDSDKQLNYHAWSADPTNVNSFWSRQAAPFLGCSPEFWGRSMGWMFAALVDVLEFMPKDLPDYDSLQVITRQVAAGLKRWQDPDAGVWYQLLQYDAATTADGKGDVVNNVTYNVGTLPNYLEASCSSMFTYAFFKAIRLGLIDQEIYLPVAKKAYAGLLHTFITISGSTLSIGQICASAGLGPFSNPSRTGTINYYLCGKDVSITQNEGKAIGPFIMASLEYEKYQADSIVTSIDCKEVNGCCNKECSFNVPAKGIYMFRFIAPDSSSYTLKSACKAGENKIWYTDLDDLPITRCEIYTVAGHFLSSKIL